jgi:hypothetical protein
VVSFLFFRFLFLFFFFSFFYFSFNFLKKFLKYFFLVRFLFSTKLFLVALIFYPISSGVHVLFDPMLVLYLLCFMIPFLSYTTCLRSGTKENVGSHFDFSSNHTHLHKCFHILGDCRNDPSFLECVAFNQEKNCKEKDCSVALKTCQHLFDQCIIANTPEGMKCKKRTE